MFYNGTPSYRIWVIGTKHLLGVEEKELSTEDPQHPSMPSWIQKMTGGDASELYGDFAVCPLTNQKAGFMQTVCVESGKHIIVKPYGFYKK